MNQLEIKFGPVTARPFWWWGADSRGVEALSAMVAWYWGVLLLLPVRTFAASRSYDAMAAVAAEWVWGLMICAVALTQSLAMCGGVKFFRYPGAVLAFITWAGVAFLFGASNPATHAVGIYSILAAFNLWVLARGPRDDG